MTLKTKLKTALRSGPKNIHQLAVELYGESNERNIAAVRMVIVRLRRDRVAITTDKEITYELTDTDPKPRKDKTVRNARQHNPPI